MKDYRVEFRAGEVMACIMLEAKGFSYGVREYYDTTIVIVSAGSMPRAILAAETMLLEFDEKAKKKEELPPIVWCFL